MRTQIIFNNVSAASPLTVGVSLTSPLEVNDLNTQDVRFLLQCSKSGTDGNPRIILEESIDGNLWTALEDTETWNNYSELVDVLGIKDNYFMARYLRIRLEPNGVTTGTVYGIIGFKTKP
jgi:hypothetical protein